VPAGRTGSAAPGLYLVSFPMGGEEFTAPAPGLPLAAFPLSAGARLSGVQAADGTAAISFDAVVSGPAAVGTCAGGVLDSWEIDLTGGTFTDSATLTSLKFDASLFVGTEFGGLILSRYVEAFGTTGVPAAPAPAPSGTPTPSDTSAPPGTPTPSGPAPSSSSSTGPPLVATRYQFQARDTINADPAG
jgi:hypothetical protein